VPCVFETLTRLLLTIEPVYYSQFGIQIIYYIAEIAHKSLIPQIALLWRCSTAGTLTAGTLNKYFADPDSLSPMLHHQYSMFRFPPHSPDCALLSRHRRHPGDLLSKTWRPICINPSRGRFSHPCQSLDRIWGLEEVWGVRGVRNLQVRKQT